MSINLSELSQAPWTIKQDHESGGYYIPDAGGDYPMLLPEDDEMQMHMAALEFAALARNAFDVMMQRGWGVHRCGDGWNISGILGLMPEQRDFVEWCYGNDRCWPNPFTALVEADTWYKENVPA